MRAYDLIEKKKCGMELEEAEIRYLIRGFVEGEIPDYQMSAFLMAVCFQGMTDRELRDFTLEMAHSGEMIDLSAIAGCKVDKHSTGGVGDKTTLIVAPIAAACGAKVAKMSGRGLGHTGGTVDKLESIPGFQTELSRERFFEIVNRVGVCVIGQSGNLAPADKKLYALRDVTATVDSIPLIASSIMSKKLAAGSDAILLDVKTGSGAFMKTAEDSVALAEKMVAIGEQAGRRVAALITDMDRPLGHAVGNALEVREAAEVLRGGGPEDLNEVSLALAAGMLNLAGLGTLEECRKKAEEAVCSGAAFEKLCEMVEAQGGDAQMLREPERFPKAGAFREIRAAAGGYISGMDTEGIGAAAVLLGAGRSRKEDTVDPAAGIHLCRKTGDRVQEEEVLAVLFAESEAQLDEAEARFRGSFAISVRPPEKRPLIYALVDRGGVHRL